MSLCKAIKHGKEHRKPYYKSGRFDRTCRPGGSCPYCKSSRLHKHRRAEPAPDGKGVVMHGVFEGYFEEINQGEYL